MIKKKNSIDAIALEKIMVERRLSNIAELSRASGINRNTITDILKGNRAPTYSVMCRLVNTLNIPLDTAGRIFFNTNLPNA